jgi:hypothetical protein
MIILNFKRDNDTFSEAKAACSAEKLGLESLQKELKGL